MFLASPKRGKWTRCQSLLPYTLSSIGACVAFAKFIPETVQRYVNNTLLLNRRRPLGRAAERVIVSLYPFRGTTVVPPYHSKHHQKVV